METAQNQRETCALPGGISLSRCSKSPFNRIMRCGQDQLIKYEIQPAAKFETGLPNGAAMHKSETLVKTDAYRVGGVDRSDENVITLLLGGSYDFLQEQLPDASPAKTRIHIHRVLDRIFIGWEGP